MKELIIIETTQPQKIKKLLEEAQVDYKIYQGTESEEEFWRRSVRLASQDQQRNKEIATWDKIASKVKNK